MEDGRDTSDWAWARINKARGFSPARIGRPLKQHADIRLLAVADEAFEMSALATCETLRREFEVHGAPAAA